MADRVKLVERIAARGRRKLEKRNIKRAEETANREAAAASLRAAEDAIVAKRAQRRAETQARQLRAARRGPPTAEQILAKQARRAKAEERRAYREFLAAERIKRNGGPTPKRIEKWVRGPRPFLTEEQAVAKRNAEIAEVERIFARRRAKDAARAAQCLPPLPY